MKRFDELDTRIIPSIFMKPFDEQTLSFLYLYFQIKRGKDESSVKSVGSVESLAQASDATLSNTEEGSLIFNGCCGG